MALKDKIIDRAQKYIQKGSIDKAIAEYRAAADLDPKDIAIRLRLGELYVKINRTADAIKEYTEVAKANTQKGFYLKAIAVYKQVLKLDDHLEVHYKLADLYTRQRLIADAVSEYSHIVHTFEKKGKHNEVLELLKKMIEIDPENIGIRIKLAELYQKLAFDKDALVEYESLFAKLMEQGKLEKAEKVYLGLFNSNPNEPVILKGLSDLYARKGDSAKFLKFAAPLFRIYRDKDEKAAAMEVSREILRRSPDDPDCVEFVKRSGSKDLSVAEQSVSTEQSAAQDATASTPESWTEERGSAGIEKTVEAEEPAEAEKPAEEEIEITLEGFEDTVGEADESRSGSGQEGLDAAKAASDVAEEQEEVEVEIDLGNLEKEAQEGAEEARPAEPSVEAEATAEVQELKAEAEEPVVAEEPAVEIEVEAPEEVQDLKAEAEEPVVAEEPAVEIEIETTAEVQELKSVAEEPVVAEEPFVEVEIETPAEVQELKAEAEEPSVATPVEVSAEAEEFDESLEDALEEAIEEVNLKISEAEERHSHGATKEGPKHGALGPAEIEKRLEALLEDEPQGAQAPGVFEGLREPGAGVVPERAETEAESAEAVREASGAISELIGKISPDEMLVEPERLRMEEVPESARTDDYVDLSAELGMEETVQDMAGSWGGADSKEAYDEFKSGISQQLSKEDTETHYNLGIAYMEMELHSEASKEFKIALKDPHLEFDCLTRLGLCAMSEGSPQEAIGYYTRGLKIEGKSEGERMGMMYELALAYEAAGNKGNSDRIFNAIYDANPDYREVATKVTLSVPDAPKAGRIPLDDGVIDVELL